MSLIQKGTGETNLDDPWNYMTNRRFFLKILPINRFLKDNYGIA